MECTCIAGVYNFFIKAVDTETLVYKDLSDWMDDTNYVDPETYTVLLIPPGTTKSTTLTLSVTSNNKISIGKLKDGIYCFETTSCGVKYTKSVAIFPKLECCIKQAWATLGIEFKSKIEEVESYLKMASINAELNNVKTAGHNLKIAEKLLENLKCDCSC